MANGFLWFDSTQVYNEATLITLTFQRARVLKQNQIPSLQNKIKQPKSPWSVNINKNAISKLLSKHYLTLRNYMWKGKDKDVYHLS